MSDIRVKVIDQQITFETMPVIASGGVNEDAVVFDFDSIWDDYEKNAVFYRSDSLTDYTVMIEDGRAVIPHEVTDTPGKIYFGVRGVRDADVMTSELAPYTIISGTSGKESRTPSLDIYEQILNHYKHISELVDEMTTEHKKTLEEAKAATANANAAVSALALTWADNDGGYPGTDLTEYEADLNGGYPTESGVN